MKNSRFLLRVALLCSFFGALEASALEKIDFDAILRSENVEIKSLYERKEALKNSKEEAELLYGWQLIGEISNRNDRSPSQDPGFIYESRNNLNSQIGLQKNFSFGLQTSLLLNATQAAIKGQQLGTGTINSTQWTTQPSFELKLPLLSGAWGKKIQAEYRALVLRKSIEYLSSEIEYENKTNAAKVFFWSSVLQKGLVDSKKQTYERIASLYKIISKKRAQNLEGTSNFLQAKSAIEQTELDLKESELSLNQFERLLKLAINKSYDFSFQKYDFKKFGKAKKADFINKITANEKILILSEDLQNTLTVSTTEDYRPKLDLFASYAFNGVESEWSDSLSEVAKNKQPTTVIGLRWAVLLDQKLVRRAQDRQAALANISKAKMSYYETEQKEALIDNIVIQQNQLVDMLSLNLRLVQTQKDKLENERSLLNQGRSTIYQVLQFELDLARADSMKFRSALELEKIQQQLEQYRYSIHE